jgi:hypothetical protein
VVVQGTLLDLLRYAAKDGGILPARFCLSDPFFSVRNETLRRNVRSAALGDVPDELRRVARREAGFGRKYPFARGLMEDWPIRNYESRPAAALASCLSVYGLGMNVLGSTNSLTRASVTPRPVV